MKIISPTSATAGFLFGFCLTALEKNRQNLNRKPRIEAKLGGSESVQMDM